MLEVFRVRPKVPCPWVQPPRFIRCSERGVPACGDGKSLGLELGDVKEGVGIELSVDPHRDRLADPFIYKRRFPGREPAEGNPVSNAPGSPEVTLVDQQLGRLSFHRKDVLGRDAGRGRMATHAVYVAGL